MSYKYNSPQEWLIHKIQEWPEQDLRRAFIALVSKVDPGEIQDLFQEEMTEDILKNLGLQMEVQKQ